MAKSPEKRKVGRHGEAVRTEARGSVVAGGALGIPGPPAWDFVARRILLINRTAGQSGLKVATPTGDDRDRDRISTSLMLVLRETRDRDTFELLYLLNARVLYNFCAGRLRHRVQDMEAADLVDEAFLRIFEKCDTFRQSERATFTGWAVVILENLIRRNVQRCRRNSSQPLPQDGELACQDGGPLSCAIQGEHSRLAEESWSIIVRLCASGLLRLPPRWRRALELRESHDLPYAEIARRMGVTRGHVGMLIRRARGRILDQLRQALNPYKETNHG